MNYFLGMDMGTSSIKVTLVDETAQIICSHKLAVNLINPAEGFYEIDPLGTWWKKFKDLCSMLKVEVDLKEIKAVCVSSVCGSFVPVDGNLNPLYNAILYGIDTRSQQQVSYLNAKYGEEYLREHLGGVFTTHSIIPKILWLKEKRPDIYKNCRYFVESNNFVTSYLTGRVAWDYPTAAGTKLVDFRTMILPEKIFDDNELDVKKIPDFTWPTTKLGEVHRQAAIETGLREGTAVMMGGCDINAEALAVGAVYPGDLVIVYGSTISSLLTTENYLNLRGFTPGMSVLEDTYRLGAATSSGARFIQWVDDFLEEEYKIRQDDLPTGILMLPYLDGARAPFDNPLARSVFFGISRQSEKKDFFAAAREAIGYEIRLLLEKMGAVYPVPDTINSMGGLVNDPVLMQIVSDITGKKQNIFTGIDASYGDALLAMLSQYKMEELNQLENVKKARKPSRFIEPNPGLVQSYIPLVEKYNRLYESLKNLF